MRLVGTRVRENFFSNLLHLERVACTCDTLMQMQHFLHGCVGAKYRNGKNGDVKGGQLGCTIRTPCVCRPLTRIRTKGAGG